MTFLKDLIDDPDEFRLIIDRICSPEPERDFPPSLPAGITNFKDLRDHVCARSSLDE